MDTPDPTTIDFNLSWPDNQFITALAEPAASIVDEDVYDPDTIRGLARGRRRLGREAGRAGARAGSTRADSPADRRRPPSLPTGDG